MYFFSLEHTTNGDLVSCVLQYYGATEYGSGPPALGTRSPRESYDPEAENFSRMRGSYQNVPPAP